MLRVATENGKVETKCRRDVVLQCTAEVKPGLQYMAVRWYKVNNTVFRGYWFTVCVFSSKALVLLIVLGARKGRAVFL